MRKLKIIIFMLLDYIRMLFILPNYKYFTRRKNIKFNTIHRCGKFNFNIGMLPYFFYRVKQFTGLDPRTHWQQYRMYFLGESALSLVPLLKLFIVSLFYIGRIWPCGMEVSLRGLNILLCNIRGNLPRFVGDIVLSRHVSFVKRNLEFNGIKSNNHYLTNLVFLRLVERKYKLKLMVDLDVSLRKALKTQFLDDGCNFENSSHYHILATELFAISYVWGLCDFDDNLKNNLDRALILSKLFMFDDVDAACFGDSDTSSILDRANFAAETGGQSKMFLEQINYENYRQMLLDLAPDRAACEYRISKLLNILSKEYYGDFLFETGGYFIRKTNCIHVVLRLPPIGNTIPFHAHVDYGCVEVYYKRRIYSTIDRLYKYASVFEEREFVLGQNRRGSMVEHRHRIQHAFDGRVIFKSYKLNVEEDVITLMMDGKVQVYETCPNKIEKLVKGLGLVPRNRLSYGYV